MKRCPECRRDYYDETLLYCLDDGAALLEGPAPAVSFDAAHLSESPTQIQTHTTGQTAVFPTRNFQTADETPGRPRRKLVIAAATLGAVVAVIAVGYFAFRSFTSQKSIASIAVMPFVNASGNADTEYLSDGMTETLINSLSQLPSVSVKARSLVFRYKGKDFDPKQVATELGAEVILNGRVLQRGNQITLSLDLVDAATGNQMWGEQYNRDISELVVLQKEIARDVSNKLTTKISGTDEINIAKSSTVDPEAYQLYLQGLFQWNRRTEEGAAKSREYFQQAIEKDPKYALAYAGVASSYVVTSDLPSKERHPKAKAAAIKALELDPSLGEARAVLANVAFYFDWDWPTSEREFRRAIELSPNYATAHHWFGEVLSAMGRFDESFAEYRKATELDPISPAISSDLAMAYYNSRQYDRAIDHLKKLIELNPGFVRSYFYLANIYEETGKFPEAIETRRTGILKSNPDAPKVDYAVNRVRKALAESGEPGYWKVALDLNLEYAKENKVDIDPLYMAFAYSRLNQRDKAFEWMEKAFDARSNGMATLSNPSWDKLRDDPRFAELVRRVGIPSR